MKYNFVSTLVVKIKRALSLVGVALIILAASGVVYVCYRVEPKLLAILLSSLVWFILGWLFSFLLRKVAFFGSVERDNNEKSEKDQSEIKRLQQDNEKLRIQNSKLASQRIDINTVQSILKIGLAEANMVIKDVSIEWMDDFNEGGLIESIFRATRSKYVGVLQRSFKAVIGVDLAKLRVHDDGDAIRVVGIVPESMGFKDYASEWLLRATHKYKLKSKPLDGMSNDSAHESADMGFEQGDKYYEIDSDEKAFEGSLDLNRIEKYSAKQEKDFEARINSVKGLEFEDVSKNIRMMAMGFIKVLFAPVGKPVKFDEETSPSAVQDKDGWFSIEEFAKNYNNRLAMTPLLSQSATCSGGVTIQQNIQEVA